MEGYDGETEDGVARARPAMRQERLAYLAGLAEGLERDEDPATGGLLTGIVEMLEELARDVGEVRRQQASLADDMDELADEIGVEASDIVVACRSCGREVAFSSDLVGDDELELTCPNCGEVVYAPGEDELVDEAGSDPGAAEPGQAGAGRPAPGGDRGGERPERG